jgi:hypothetical protein
LKQAGFENETNVYFLALRINIYLQIETGRIRGWLVWAGDGCWAQHKRNKCILSSTTDQRSTYTYRLKQVGFGDGSFGQVMVAGRNMNETNVYFLVLTDQRSTYTYRLKQVGFGGGSSASGQVMVAGRNTENENETNVYFLVLWIIINIYLQIETDWRW